MPEFTLYAFVFRSRAERVTWCLEELGLSFELKRLDPMKGELWSPAFTRMNPMRKVPVLVHRLPGGDERVLCESVAIMEYLNDYARGGLKPVALEESYQYHQVMSFGASEMEAYLWVVDQATHLRGAYHWPAGTELEAMRNVQRAVPAVCGWLAHRAYIAGNVFTLADIYYYQLLTWAAHCGVKWPAHVQRYLQRLEQRPAMPALLKGK